MDFLKNKNQLRYVILVKKKLETITAINLVNQPLTWMPQNFQPQLAQNK